MTGELQRTAVGTVLLYIGAHQCSVLKYICKYTLRINSSDHAVVNKETNHGCMH